MASRKPLRINAATNYDDRETMQQFRNQSVAALSQSLGAYPGRNPILPIDRRLDGNSSAVSYAGYLLKRSNKPQQATLISTPWTRSITSCHGGGHSESQKDTERSSESNALRGDSTPLPFPAYTDSHFPQDLDTQPQWNSISQTGAQWHDAEDFDSSMAFAESFLGVNLRSFDSRGRLRNAAVDQDDTSTRTELTARLSPTLLAAKQRSNRRSSLPIKIQRNVTLIKSASSDGPKDIQDEDGHVWRAKYCVLEGGVLYFYRSRSDAHEPEARKERREHLMNQNDLPNSSPCNSTIPNHLTQSPIPSKAVKSSADHYWEKYVVLSSVASVRSAEAEYGPNSLELASDEDSTEKLILRAQSPDDMKEWWFQFIRTIESYLHDLVKCATALPAVDAKALVEARHTAAAGELRRTLSPDQLSSARHDSTVSPRCFQSLNTPISLSHGHGRHSQFRRRCQPSDQQLERLAISYHDPSPMSFVHLMPRLEREDYSPLLRPNRAVTPTPSERELETTTPELSAPQSDYPEMERPPPSRKGRYVPPMMRGRRPLNDSSPSYSGVEPRASLTINYPAQASNNDIPHQVRSHGSGRSISPSPDFEARAPKVRDGYQGSSGFVKMGGCADPDLVRGSILDDAYIPLKASRVSQGSPNPFGGSFCSGNLCWEIGATSLLGIRETNEDAYLIVADLLDALKCYREDSGSIPLSFWEQGGSSLTPSVFAILDGHCGDQAARFVAERLLPILHDQSLIGQEFNSAHGHHNVDPLDHMRSIIHRTFSTLDSDFCNLCVDNGRQWESGTTALIATLVEDHLIIANLGDARGVLCRTVPHDWSGELEEDAMEWNELPSFDSGGQRRCLWREVTDIHSPSREDERARIEEANGWVTFEKEIPVGQLKRMALFDQDVVDILKRCFSDRYQSSPRASAPQRAVQISRVCGELAVSRAIGDRDFKAAFNAPRNPVSALESPIRREWDSPLFLPFPENHSRSFKGDLVSNQPEFQTVRIGELGVAEEFLLLACDGLWDVMDADDAVRLARDLLFVKGWSAEKAAKRLAELAMHLGSSDNITVIVLRFHSR